MIASQRNDRKHAGSAELACPDCRPTGPHHDGVVGRGEILLTRLRVSGGTRGTTREARAAIALK
jgi:hypothetical protein